MSLLLCGEVAQKSSSNPALLGALIGGGAIGVIGTLITTWSSFHKDELNLKRQLKEKQIADFSETCVFSINVIYNITTGGSPDRTSRGVMIAKLKLFGNEEINNLLKEFVKDERSFDVQRMVKAMKIQLDDLKRELMEI